MKATLEFNLPEETEEYETTMSASKMSSFIHEMVNGGLRSVTKYDNFEILQDIDKEKLTEKEHELVQNVIQSVRSYIARTLDENGLGDF